MASCPPEALIATSPCLLELSETALRTVQYGAIKSWALSGNPALDTGLNGSMTRAACLMELSDNALRGVIFSTLCNIASGGS